MSNIAVCTVKYIKAVPTQISCDTHPTHTEPAGTMTTSSVRVGAGEPIRLHNPAVHPCFGVSKTYLLACFGASFVFPRSHSVVAPGARARTRWLQSRRRIANAAQRKLDDSHRALPRLCSASRPASRVADQAVCHSWLVSGWWVDWSDLGDGGGEGSRHCGALSYLQRRQPDARVVIAARQRDDRA